MNSENKISFMHSKFGKADGKCKDCPNFVRVGRMNKRVRKCRVYGMSHSVATDWNAGFDACGLFGANNPEGELYLENGQIRAKFHEEVEGQISIKELATTKG